MSNVRPRQKLISAQTSWGKETVIRWRSLFHNSVHLIGTFMIICEEISNSILSIISSKLVNNHYEQTLTQYNKFKSSRMSIRSSSSRSGLLQMPTTKTQFIFLVSNNPQSFYANITSLQNSKNKPNCEVKKSKIRYQQKYEQQALKSRPVSLGNIRNSRKDLHQSQSSKTIQKNISRIAQQAFNKKVNKAEQINKIALYSPVKKIKKDISSHVDDQIQLYIKLNQIKREVSTSRQSQFVRLGNKVHLQNVKKKI